jgi:HAD superfamily hydrolase (TIGR01484 family)
LMYRMDKKLVFFDIDGTLVSHAGETHVPKATAEAVDRLARNGHVPAIATARNMALTRKTAGLFGIELAVCCNGAHVARTGDETCIYEAWLDDVFTSVFRAEAFSVSDQAYALDERHVYTNWERDFLDAFITGQAGAGCKKSLSELERCQLAYIFEPLPRRWRERGGLDGVDVIEEAGGAGGAGNAGRYAEFRPQGVSKWSGIVKAAAWAGFELDDIIAVGDGLNDMEMIKNASLGIAVGGARDELKAAADMVTGDIDEGGILSAFRSLGMI